MFVLEWMMNLALPETAGRLDMYYTVQTIQKLDQYLPKAGFAVTDMERLRKIAWDFQYIQGMRNMVLHGNEDAAMDKRLRKTLQDMGYDTGFAAMSVQNMTDRIRRALKRAAP